MLFVRSLPSILGCFLLALVVACGFSWMFFVCAQALWEAARGMWYYHSTLRVVTQGTGQLILLAIMLFQLVVGGYIASILVAKGTHTARYQWYLYRGGDPLYYMKYSQDKPAWRAVAFRKLT